MKLNRLFHVVLFVFASFLSVYAQNVETGVDGRVVDENNDPIAYATVALFNATDSTMAKAGYADENGNFHLTYLTPGNYYLNISFVGYDTYITEIFPITENTTHHAGQLSMSPFATALGEVVVASTKPVVEVKPDKTVFNVEGSVNSIGNNALELLRKAPGVVVDNNERLMLVGKTGVKVYIDGKQSILSGDDLANYLKTLQSTQIEAIEIITQPSARFEAEGNAGIINIRLIKDKSLGTNATVSLGYNQGVHGAYNANLNVNNRTKNLSLFGNLSHSNGENSQWQSFTRITPDIHATQDNAGVNEWNNVGFRGGLDITSGQHSTIGFLFDGNINDGTWRNQIHTYISPDVQTPFNQLLEGSSRTINDRHNYNLNGNYRFDNKKGKVLNIDLDYGKYDSEGDSYQPNYYYNIPSGDLTDTRIFSSNTPTTIDIKTFKVDFENPFLKGNLGLGMKLALINTDNTYNFYDIVDDTPVLNTDRSNNFTYDENVNAGYVSYNRQGQKFGVQFGIRVEQTDSKGELTAYVPQNNETVDQEYVDVFPSGGVTYNLNQNNSFRITYSRRIDRPNYQDLNPFEFKLDEITFQKGNPFLRPQYSNSISLGHT